MVTYKNYYVTPFIYPLLPKECGKLVIDYSVNNVLKFRTKPGFTGVFTISFVQYECGKEVRREDIQAKINNGKSEYKNIVRKFSGNNIGYVEVSIAADKPAFDKVMLVQGYGLFINHDRGSMTFGSDLKYARAPIIDQIATFGMFCMQHTAAYINKTKNIGNSFLLINPYEQKIVVTIKNSSGKVIRKRVDKKTSLMLSLEELLTEGVLGTVMLTANNKITVFDVRHAYDNLLLINNIDHLDFMNGWSTHRNVPIKSVCRYLIKRFARNLKLYFS